MKAALCIALSLFVCSYADLGLTPGEYVRIEGGAGTFCGDGSDFAFFVREGDPNKVVIEMEGGGACGDFGSCYESIFAPNDKLTELEGFLPGSSMGFDGAPEWVRGPFAPNGKGFGENGVLFNDELTTADWTIVYIPHCTLDLGLGDSTGFYQNPADPADVRQMRHNGLANTMYVVNWVFDNFPNPTKMLTTGCSGGTLTSIYIMKQLEAHYGTGRRAPKYYFFGDSYFQLGTPLSLLITLQWGAECPLLEMLNDYVDMTDPQEYQRSLVEDSMLLAFAKRTTATVMLYSAVGDIIQRLAYDMTNPTIAPNTRLYPDDMLDVQSRQLFSELSKMRNVKLYLVDEYTHMPDAFDAQGNFLAPEVMGISHCSTSSGAFWFTFMNPRALPAYIERFGSAFALPYLGYRPDLIPENFVGSVDWFNAVIDATSSAAMPESIICDTCTTDGGAGCDGNTDTFVPYNGCGGCGDDKSGCTLDSKGKVLSLDITKELIVNGKTVTQVVTEQLFASRFATFPAINYVTVYQAALPRCAVRQERECLALWPGLKNQFCDKNCNHVPQFCPARMCACAQTIRPTEESVAGSQPSYRGRNGVSDAWCQASCTHVPSVCPPLFCEAAV